MTDTLLEAVQVVARLAGDVALAHYRTALAVESKSDGSPVTIADREAEQAARAWIAQRFPADGILGEEFGATEGTSGRRWLLDPIDGTKSFVRGVPVWATLIALEVDGEIVVGVVSAPLLQRRWWAAAGQGAWTGRSLLKATRCQVSDVRRLEDASLSYSSLHGWEERDRLYDFMQLMRRVWRTRAYGDFWSYMLLAEGAVDIATEPELKLYDMAALDVIVREAGGTFTSLDGEPGPYGGNAVATNGHLHDAVLSFLGSPSEGGSDPDQSEFGGRSGNASVHDLRAHRGLHLADDPE